MLKLISAAIALSALVLAGTTTSPPLAEPSTGATAIIGHPLTDRPAPEVNELAWRNGCIIFFCH